MSNDKQLNELHQRIVNLEKQSRDNYFKITLLESEIVELKELLGKLRSVLHE